MFGTTRYNRIAPSQRDWVDYRKIHYLDKCRFKESGELVQITIDEKRIAAFCRSHQIKHMALFGSVLRDDFRSDSDIDVLVVFAPESRHTLFDLIQIEVELEGILGRKVDLVDRAAVEQSRNYIRRDAILESLEPIYAA